MLDIVANVLYLGVLTVTNTQLMSTYAVEFPPQGAVAEVAFRPVTTIWSDIYECRFTGVMVPYTRDWEEVTDNGLVKTVLPPEPNKTAGYAYIINKKTCPGKEPEAMFSTGQWFGGFLGNTGMSNRFRLTVTSLNPDPDLRPKWLNQVMGIVAHEAESKPVAKSFLTFTQEHMQVAKEKAEAKSQAQPGT